MITFSRKHKIIAVAVLLLVAVVLVLNSVLTRKPTLSVSSGVKNKKFVKVAKPANKKAKISDSNQITAGSKKNNKAEKTSKANKSADKNSKIIDSNHTAKFVTELAPAVSDEGNEKSAQGDEPTAKPEEIAGQALNDGKIAEMIKTLASSVTAGAGDKKSAGNGEVLNSDQIAAISKAMLAGKDGGKLTAEMLTGVGDTQPEAKTTQSGIQSLVFAKNMPIVDALQLLGARYGKNIVPTSKVTGNLVFTKLTNVNFDEAMSAILGENYRYQEQGSMIKVYAADEHHQTMPKSNEMTCKVFTLYYISAAEAKKMVMPVMSMEGKIEITTAAETGVPVDETLSTPKGGGDSLAINDMMVVYDYPQRIEAVEQILAAIDIRPKQVLIEATIMTAALTDGTQFGIDWRNLKNVALELTPGASDIYDFHGTDTKIGSSALTGGLSVGVVRDDVAAFIRAVEEVTDVTILANPKILATNKQLGQVYIGTKVAYQSAITQTDTSTTQTIEFLDTGTKLSFRPYIGNDGYIRMDIHPKDSSAVIRNIGTSSVPDETSAELVSNIIVKDGETVVIGGLFRNTVSNKKTQVPLLGNLPVVGTAFSSTADEGRREEVIVLLTPHIIGEPSQSMGAERSNDVERKISGAKKQLNPLNKMRLAQDSYEKGAVYYAQGKNAAALKELKSALELYPDYTEAVQLQEKINSESDPKWKPRRKIIDETQQPQSGKWRRK